MGARTTLDYLLQYGLFLAETLTIVVAVAAVAARRRGGGGPERLEVRDPGASAARFP